MVEKHHFFTDTNKKPNTSSQLSEPATYSDVCSVRDGGLRAAAFAVIDLFVAHPLMIGKEDMLKIIIEQHVAIFSSSVYVSAHATYSHRWQQLMRHCSSHKLVNELAETLRHIAIKELFQFPARYPQAFLRTEVADVHSTNEFGEGWALHALSRQLGLPITIEQVEQRNTLAKCCQYTIDSSCPGIVIRVDNGHYRPYLHKPLQAHISAQLSPEAPLSLSDAKWSDLLGNIRQELCRIQQEFESVQAHLQAQYLRPTQDGGLSLDDLLAIYLKCFESNDAVSYANYAGIEFGTQHFFEQFLPTQSQSTALIADKPHAYLVCELMHAIARSVSLGQVSRCLIYKDNDETEATTQPVY